MTDREQEILHRIEENPMISQDQLAEELGITRSSVGVHISNLMKKGQIVGRGYVLRSKPYVAVVGGTNIDIGGTPMRDLTERDSNPGRVRVSLGGVGRNIAYNLALLGQDVRFFTALGEDDYARRVMESCQGVGIDVSKALKVAGKSTSVYLYINDVNGDMRVAVSDMEICERITPVYLATCRELLNHAAAIVIDANLPEASIRYLAENAAVPVLADPVSAAKADKLRPVLDKLSLIKPNRIEAEVLSGVRITDEASLREAAQRILAAGCKEVFITLGADGVLAADQEEMQILPCYDAMALAMTGAGDAFMAGLVTSFIAGGNLKEQADWARASAAVAVESSETVNPVLSAARVRDRIRHVEEKNQ